MTVALLLLALLGTEPLITVSPPEWDFGRLEARSRPVMQEVLLSSRAQAPVTVSLTSTCDCLSVEPSSLELSPGGSSSFRLRYDPRGEKGPVEKYLIIRTSLPELPKALYLVRGAVGEAETEEEAVTAGAEEALNLDFYYAPGCRSCLRLLRRTLPALERRLGLSFAVREHDILDPSTYADYQRLLASLGERERAFPALVVGRSVMQGEREIKAKLEQSLYRLKAGAAAPPQGAEAQSPRLLSRLALLPVLAAGLLDGVNPCAFTTLVFLLSSLAAAGRSRRELAWIGLCFALAVFLTYLAIGIGLFQAVRLAAAFPLVAAALRWLLVAALVVLAGLSLYDFALIRSGRSQKIILQLPKAVKQRIHRDIRSRVRAGAMAASSLALGFLVAVFELACTGQVYFPTLVYLYRVRPGVSGFLYLLLYNLGFILPLLAVFALAYWGVASRRLAAFVQRSLGAVKIALAVLFLGLAALTVFT